MDDDFQRTGRDAGWYRLLRQRLLRWYAESGRALPWRASGNPYATWISEVMLQQTTVVAVVPYYQRFLERFPTVHTLAEAPIDQVLRLWEGLGYYSRARNLHRAAQQIVKEFGGVFPNRVEQLQSLPGIGRYTAGAIASFAFDEPAPIVEANTLRLYTRLLDYDGDPRSAIGAKMLWSFATAVLPRRGAGTINQALMDLGAVVCKVSNPDCDHCPLVRSCGAFAAGRQHEIPRPAPRPEVTRVTEIAVAVQSRGRVLLRQRTETERWAGLWDFPRTEITPSLQQSLPTRLTDGHPLPANLQQVATSGLLELTSLPIELGHILCTMNYSVTRYRVHLICVAGRLSSTRLTRGTGSLQWAPFATLTDIPLSITARRLANHITSD